MSEKEESQEERGRAGELQRKIAEIHKKYRKLSVCEVQAGEEYVRRLADLSNDGEILPFGKGKNKNKRFAGWDRIYTRSFPEDGITVGVWGWTVTQNKNDPSKDYVVSEYLEEIPVPEIVVFRSYPEYTLAQLLKKGWLLQFHTSRILAVQKNEEGSYAGFEVERSQTIKRDNGYVVNSDVPSLNSYLLEERDLVRLADECFYLKNLSKEPAGRTLLVEPGEIVRKALLDSATWNTFKQLGKTRKEWRHANEFLETMPTEGALEAVAAECMISPKEARGYIEKFVAQARELINGETFEDALVEAVVAANAPLQQRLKSLVKEDWTAENQMLVSQMKEERERLGAEIEEKARCYEGLVSEKEEQVKELSGKIEQLKEEHREMEEKIEVQKLFAATMEETMNSRIESTRQHVAELAGELAFVNQFLRFEGGVSIAGGGEEKGPAEGAEKEPEPEPEQEQKELEKAQGEERKQEERRQTESPAASGCGMPEPISEEYIEEIGSWQEAVDVISIALEDAGVSVEYSRELAVFLLTAYRNRICLLVAGPGAEDIVDAFSCGLFGKTAGVLHGEEENLMEQVRELNDAETPVIRVTHLLDRMRSLCIPDLTRGLSGFPFFVHPFVEDIKMEPGSLFSYVLPLFTDAFVDKPAGAHMVGGRLKEGFSWPHGQKQGKKKRAVPELSGLRVKPFVQNRMMTMMKEMASFFTGENDDAFVFWTIAPYAYVTDQIQDLLEAISEEEGPYQVSGQMAGTLRLLYEG